MEDVLSSKFKEFMTALDHVRKYSALMFTLPDFIIICAVSVITGLSVLILGRLDSIWIPRSVSTFPNSSFLFFVSLLTGIIVGVFWVNRKLKSVKVGQWKQVLDEGLPGVLNLLQDLNWNKIFNEIRYAKLGSWLYGITKIGVYWFLTVIIFSLVTQNLLDIWHLGSADFVVEFFSLVLVLVLSRKDIYNRYHQIGRLDWLLWELRWFESEFRGANFKT